MRGPYHLNQLVLISNPTPRSGSAPSLSLRMDLWLSFVTLALLARALATSE